MLQRKPLLFSRKSKYVRASARVDAFLEMLGVLLKASLTG